MKVICKNGDLKNYLVSIFMKCPVGEALDSCPANNYRKMTREQRRKLADIMSEEDIIKIIDHHIECLQGRKIDEDLNTNV